MTNSLEIVIDEELVRSSCKAAFTNSMAMPAKVLHHVEVSWFCDSCYYSK